MFQKIDSGVRTLSIDSKLVFHPITLNNNIGYSYLLLQNYFAEIYLLYGNVAQLVRPLSKYSKVPSSIPRWGVFLYGFM